MTTNLTNAPTAEPEAITQKTVATDTADGAVFGTHPTIKSFIDGQFAKLRSEDFSGIKRTAESAARHGFSKCANLRYAEFLEAFRENPRLASHYAARYPNCVFLPWKAFHLVRRTLDLWCDLPEHYCGAVPDEQMPWLDIFSLSPGDRVCRFDDYDPDPDAVWSEDMMDLLEYPHERRSMLRFGLERSTISSRHKIQPFLKQFMDSYFVVAPADAFDTKEDWIERFRRLIEDAYRPPNPPDDPLVIRFCKGGCLIVAAWGDEAQEINNLVKKLNL